MSSAALQSPPHQPTALASPPLPSSSNRQFGSPHSSPSREAYHGHQAAASSPSSRRPPSRKRSGNGASPSVDPSAPRSSRNGINVASPQEHRSSRPERPITMPPVAPVAPPRTSSSNQQGSSSSTRGNHYSNEAVNSSPSQARAEGSRSGSRGDTNGYPDTTRSKRAVNSHTGQDEARPSSNREARVSDMSIPIRTNPSTSSKPAHDASDNLIRAISGAEQPNGRAGHYNSSQDHHDAAPPPVVAMNPANEERRGGRSRHDHSRSHKGTTKFGDFILGNTIGEGEFGKVKLGWKQDSSVQVAIKLIKRDTVGGNPSRLGKIRREVTILRGVQHPNIVRLIDMIETDRYIGIILEYASGGELFDYILNHRYLKDHSARRLFSQLVSGVGYLHKKGIVHRDLKLENLLLDRNRNIIITDFGFANTFDANEELLEEEELNLTDREQVKRMGLDKVKPNGMRRGDLMQTSCGSPCYAAPELVVSDSLYTGRKVDVWSCGVILYAMLAGYLPFDDDPANPEGDNINLLYKYIVSTPLTFPEYVTPHARDLLRRILVPNPRKRADLFEVARHSWLSEYAHVVEFITSSTTLPSDVQNATGTAQEFADAPMVTRSASVRETPKQKSPMQGAVGGLAKAHAKIDTEAEPTYRTPKDAKRRTVQVEYVAPTTQTQRGEDPVIPRPPVSLNRDNADGRPSSSARDKALPKEPQGVYTASSQSRRPPSAHTAGATRPRDTRATTDNAYMIGTGTAPRPQTGGSMQSAASMSLQARGNYGQPAPPAVADTNVQGRIQQPANKDDEEAVGRPNISVPPKFAKMSGFHDGRSNENRGHKRSSTIGDIGSKLLGRSGSVFSGRGKKKPDIQQPEKAKKYPPVSMSGAMTQGGEESTGRTSMDSRASRRSFSLGIGKKRSGSMTGSQGSGGKKERRRFSLLPASFSLKSIGLGKEYSEPTSSSEIGSHTDLPIQSGRLEHPRSVTAPGDARGSTPFFDNVYENNVRQGTNNSSPVYHQRYASAQLDNRRPNAIPSYVQSGSHFNSGSESSVDIRRPPTEPQLRSHSHGFSDMESHEGRRAVSSRGTRGVLQKNHKRFTDAYEQDDYRGHEGSSGAAKRVMDFFRRRGKARGGDERS
ncbi:hypothetical protein QQS21_007735 [Conoideocrella luteorostrata]|uniref:non-specific serine/threonine protein kinase n=1 Tax=Conoideocrella luteorostrata TaxID=1105319 RepID=A0AAJ0CK69_9HYPO|nr:hypothetical protein QQS21_007735 [Conoideocrella luteorostrata]